MQTLFLTRAVSTRPLSHLNDNSSGSGIPLEAICAVWAWPHMQTSSLGHEIRCIDTWFCILRQSHITQGDLQTPMSLKTTSKSWSSCPASQVLCNMCAQPHQPYLPLWFGAIPWKLPHWTQISFQSDSFLVWEYSRFQLIHDICCLHFSSSSDFIHVPAVSLRFWGKLRDGWVECSEDKTANCLAPPPGDIAVLHLAL